MKNSAPLRLCVKMRLQQLMTGQIRLNAEPQRRGDAEEKL